VSDVRVGFVGAGSMGTPMVERMLAAGHTVTVYARRAEVRDRFAAAGASVTDVIAEAAVGNQVVLECLYSDAQAEQLFLGDGGLVRALEPGAVFGMHHTGSPAFAQRVAEAARARGADAVDAPVSGANTDIEAGNLTVMLGGEPASRDRVREVIAAYSSNIFDVGAIGTAQGVKLVNNTVFAANLQLAFDTERVAAALGIELSVLVEILHASSGQSYALDVLGPIGGTEAMIPAAGHYMRKDVDATKAVAAELGLDLGLLGEVADGPVDWGAAKG
jgi:3-hydroxyisobutyrate dehydrogenase-like beta-hydroxyacid dehydrogenase